MGDTTKPTSPLIADNLQDTALGIVSALQAVREVLRDRAEDMVQAGIGGTWGYLLLVEAALEAAEYINEALDSASAQPVLNSMGELRSVK